MGREAAGCEDRGIIRSPVRNREWKAGPSTAFVSRKRETNFAQDDKFDA